MKKSSFKMKNSLLNMSSKDGSPMQANYSGSPMKVSLIRKLIKAGKALYGKFGSKNIKKTNPDLNPFSPKNQKGTKATMEIPQNLKSVRDEYTNIFLKHGKLDTKK